MKKTSNILLSEFFEDRKRIMENQFKLETDKIFTDNLKQLSTYNYLMTRKENNLIAEFNKYNLYLNLKNVKG